MQYNLNNMFGTCIKTTKPETENLPFTNDDDDAQKTSAGIVNMFLKKYYDELYEFECSYKNMLKLENDFCKLALADEDGKTGDAIKEEVLEKISSDFIDVLLNIKKDYSKQELSSS